MHHFVDATFTKKNFFYFFSQKYPAFVEFYCDEIFGATCALCKEKPGKSKLAMTNPCGHFLCVSCSCNQVRIWKEEARDRRKCPVCRTILLDHMFANPISHSSTKLHETSLYVWVPTSLYIHENHNQSFVSSLTRKDFDAAFRSAFLTATVPIPVHNAIAPEWEEFYNDKVANLRCGQCKLNLPLKKAFVAICGHFFCTLCAAFLPMKTREGALKCPECDQEIENEGIELLFIRPI